MKLRRPARAEPAKMPRQARSAVTVNAIFEATLQVLLSAGSIRRHHAGSRERASGFRWNAVSVLPQQAGAAAAVLERYLKDLAGYPRSGVRASIGERHGRGNDRGRGERPICRTKWPQASITAPCIEIAIELDSRGTPSRPPSSALNARLRQCSQPPATAVSSPIRARVARDAIRGDSRDGADVLRTRNLCHDTQRRRREAWRRCAARMSPGPSPGDWGSRYCSPARTPSRRSAKSTESPGGVRLRIKRVSGSNPAAARQQAVLHPPQAR